jgi:hypothetical protein
LELVCQSVKHRREEKRKINTKEKEKEKREKEKEIVCTY